MRKLVYVVLILLGFSACNLESRNAKPEYTKNGRYLFLGHTYHWYSDNKIDFRIQALNLKDYEMLLLGGDLCSESSKTDTSLSHIDSIYDVSNPNVLWSLGNHDLKNGSLSKIENYTKRKTYYAQYKNGITFLVLNTNFEHSQLTAEEQAKEYQLQYKLFTNIVDTIKQSSHLLILSHNVVWKDLDSLSRSFANVSKPYSFSADSSISFRDHIYPQLIKVKDKNVDVIWVAGDIGRWSKNYSFKTDDGIQFLASGINNTRLLRNPELHSNPPMDKVLIFDHDKEKQKLSWNFVELNYLYLLAESRKKEQPENRVDSLCLEIDSLYQFQEEVIAVYSKRIRDSKSWLAKVKVKAKERGIPLDEMIYRDARFLNDQNRKDKITALYESIPNPLFSYTNSDINSTKRLE